MLASFLGVSTWGQDLPRMTAARPESPMERPLRFDQPQNGSFIGLSGVPFDREQHRRGFGRNSFVYGGWPYFPPEYQAPSEPIVYVQAPAVAPAPAPPPRQEPAPSAALLELQGNQWVKVTSFTMGNSATATQEAPGASIPAKELPPAILVYRDGHTEQVSSYSIIGTTLYTKSDYWTSGAWSRKIQIADLDVPATIRQNRERGVNFNLPSGPNEVILRP